MKLLFLSKNLPLINFQYNLCKPCANLTDSTDESTNDLSSDANDVVDWLEMNLVKNLDNKIWKSRISARKYRRNVEISISISFLKPYLDRTLVSIYICPIFNIIENDFSCFFRTEIFVISTCVDIANLKVIGRRTNVTFETYFITILVVENFCNCKKNLQG